MYRAIRALLALCFFCGIGSTFAQTLGLLPQHVKWMQLHHDSLNIIFPDGQEQTARRVASLMLKLAHVDPITTGCRYKPISVLLQPQTNISNGYVGLAPYLSEFYLEPHENPFILGSLPWTDLLSLHEYRHVQQVNAANTGFSHLFKSIFGDLVFSGLYSLSVPDWYREGDAVYTETKWTLQGRGRLSQFTLPFYQKAIEGEPWDYYKVRNGSYREFTPDYYALGYMMIQYGNQTSVESTWDTIIRNAPRFKHLLRPFSGLVKEKFGRSNKGLYLEAMRCYKDECNVTRVADIEYPTIPLQPADVENDYFDMTYPAVDGDGSIYSAITTFDRTASIYRIDPGGSRKKVVSMGFQKDTYFHFSQGKFVWTELRYDPRWARRDKNVIVVYDQVKRTKKSFAPDKGYFTPSLDAKGERIVSLHVNDMNQYHLAILDAATGDVLIELPNPENLYLGYPIFYREGQSILATARNQKGEMCLIEQDIPTGKFSYITHYSYAVLGKPVVHGPWIFLTSGLSQLNQVFAIDKEEGVFYQVSGGNKAHYDPVWDPVQDGLICAEYRLDGKKLVRLSGLPFQWAMVNLNDGIKPVQGASGRNILAEPDRKTGFEIRKYSSWSDAIHFHSWVVTADDPTWGVEARSNNKLNTIAIAGGYEYNRNSQDKGPYLNVTLGMMFPQFNFGISRVNRELEDPGGNSYRRSLDRFNAGIALPLFFTSGVYQKTLYTSASYNAGFRKLKPALPGQNYSFNYASYRLLFINSRKMAYRQSLPTWGQRLDITFSHEVSGIPISQLYIAADMALPAISSSHYLLVQAEALRQDLSDGPITLVSNFYGARGFPYIEEEKQYRVGFTYGFPIWYPDKGIGNILYTRRIRLQPFFDWAFVDDSAHASTHMRSTGAEIIFDIDFPPVSIGFRFSRLLSGFEGSPNQLEFFIPSQRF